jgi:hypothetical protein
MHDITGLESYIPPPAQSCVLATPDDLQEIRSHSRLVQTLWSFVPIPLG